MEQAIDWWQERFAPAALHNAGGGYAMYRKCLHCGQHAMVGSETPHARWCDAEQRKALTLKTFDDLRHADKRVADDRRSEVRRAARGAL